MSAESELAFVARLRDDASATARKVKAELKAVGGDTSATIAVKAKDQASGALGGVRGSLERVDRAASHVGGILAGLRGPAGIAGAALGGMAALGIRAGLQTAAGMEGARISFTTMLGSAQKAGAFLKDLSAFAAKTPFEFPELQSAASSLISAGIDAKKVIPIMTTLGDVTSGMGTGSEGVQRATIALQQMTAAGKITGEDLNQLRDAGIPVFDLLAAATGKSKAEVVALAQAGKLGAKDLAKLMGALETGKGLERFSGLMDKQSASLAGQWSTLKDTANMALAGMITPVLPELKAGMTAVSGAVSAAGPAISFALTGVVEGIKSLMAGDLSGAAGTLATAFGGGSDAAGVLHRAFDLVKGVADDVVAVFQQSLGPALSTVTGEAKVFLGPLGLARQALGFMADHGEATRVVLVAIGSALIFARTAMLAHTAVTKTAAAAQFAYSLMTGKAASAEGLATRAKITGALATARAAAMTVASGVAAAASAAASAARVVAGWVLMGVQSLIQAARMAAAWVIAMGPVGWVIAAVIALVALVVTHWQQVKDATVAAWRAVAGAVVGAWEWIKGAVSAAVTWVLGFVRKYWPFLLGILTGPFGLAVGLIVQHWTSIKNAVSNGISTVISFVKGLPGRVVGAIGDLGGKLWSWASHGFERLGAAERAGIETVVGYVKALPGKILDGLGDLGSTLYDAGIDLIQGFIDGIGHMFGAVKGKLGDLTGKLTSWKGPPKRDRELLKGAGMLVIGGFIDGIDASRGDVRAALSRTTQLVQAYGSGTGALALSPVSVTATTAGVTIRHEVAFSGPAPAGVSAADVADVIARDPKSAAALEASLVAARARRSSTTLSASR